MHDLDKLYRPEPWGNKVGEDSIGEKQQTGVRIKPALTLHCEPVHPELVHSPTEERRLPPCEALQPRHSVDNAFDEKLLYWPHRRGVCPNSAPEVLEVVRVFPGRTTSRAKTPCRRALRRTAAYPSGEVNPKSRYKPNRRLQF